MTQKALIFILDGLGDRPCPQLRGKTPLQAAKTPTLDRLAAQHQCGMMDPLRPGIAVDTHTGVSILFGLPPHQAARLTRGPIEAAGIDLPAQAGDVLIRANFATVEKHAHGYRILDRRAGRVDQEAAALCAELQNIPVAPAITASLHPATQHRAVLHLRADPNKQTLSADISNTDPSGHSEHLARGILASHPLSPTEENPTNNAQTKPRAQSAQATAAAVNTFIQRAHQILDPHPLNAARRKQGKPPANGIITRSAGIHQTFPNLLTARHLKVAAVAGERTVLGLAKLFGFTAYANPRFTSLPDTDLAEKLRTATTALKTHDLVFVHIKGTDTAAHDHNPRLKSQVIAKFDRELGKLTTPAKPTSPAPLDLAKCVIGVCADHSTDSERGEHNGDPVPVLLTNPHGRRDPATAYNESECTRGALCRITAHDFLALLLDAMDAGQIPPPQSAQALPPAD